MTLISNPFLCHFESFLKIWANYDKNSISKWTPQSGSKPHSINYSIKTVKTTNKLSKFFTISIC